MLIPIPKYVLKYTDWTDREMVLFSLMLFLYRQEGSRLGVQYLFNSVDIKRILDILTSLNPDTRLDSVRRVLRVGLLSWDVWTLEFKVGKFDKTRNGRIEEVEYDIQDIEAIGLFHYLAGRFTAPGMIQDTHVKLDVDNVKGKRVGTVMDNFFSNKIFYNG